MDASGEELIATAGATAAMLAKCMSNEEIHTFNELLGLLKHNLEIIRHRRHMHETKKFK